MAGYRERDFVIFLPAWVRPEVLIINELIHLQHCRLRCYPWDPLRNAEQSRLSYKAWIRLGNLPFECWTASRVSAMVCGFGRFLKADEQSIDMMDMFGFRCLIAVDALADVPEHLSVLMGDFVVSVPVRIESTAPFGGEDHGIPLAGGGPHEGADQTDPAERQLARRISFSGEDRGDSDSREGCRSRDSGTWNSSELRDRRREVFLGSRAGGGGLSGMALKWPAVSGGHELPALGPKVLGASLEDAPSGGSSTLSLIISREAAAPRALKQPLVGTTSSLGYSLELPVFFSEEGSFLGGDGNGLQGNILVSDFPLEGPEGVLAPSASVSTADRGRSLPWKLSSRKLLVVGPAPGRRTRLDSVGGALRLGLGPSLGR